jgi:hypothetical protein
MIEFNNTDRIIPVDYSRFPLLNKATKSTEDLDDYTPKELKRRNALSRMGTFTFSDGSYMGSKGTICHLTDKGVLDNLMPTPAMNPISSRLSTPLKKLGQISPTDIQDLRGFYDHSRPEKGPFIDPATQMTYQGQIIGSVAEGWGLAITKNGDVIQGFFVDGKLDIYYRMLTRRGTFYEGGIQDSLKHGRGIFRDANGIRIRSTWVQGKATEHTEISTEESINILGSCGDSDPYRKNDKDNYIIFEGELKDGLKTGYCYVMNTSNNFAYEGVFKYDKLNGFGKKHYFSGAYYVGEFMDDVEQGKGTLHYRDGRIFKGNFESGLPHGEGELITDTGLTRLCKYNNGKRTKTLHHNSQ